LGSGGVTTASGGATTGGVMDTNTGGGAIANGGRGAGNAAAGAGATAGVTSTGGASTGNSGGAAAGGSSNTVAGGGTASGAGSAGRLNTGGGNDPESAGEGGEAWGTPTEKALSSLTAARQEHSVVAAAGEIYVIGGYSPNVTDSVQAYNPTKDEWRDVKKFPTPMNHGNAGVVADKIYVAGFYINGGMSTATTQVYSYDPATDAWTEKSPLPTGTQRAAGCVAVDQGLMYVFGGAHAGKSVDAAARYDAAADKWETLPSLPERREHCAAGAIDGILYVAGGRADGITGIEPKTWAYDPAAKSWSEKASLPPPRGGLAGAVLDGRLIVFGGEGNTAASSGVFPDVDAYDRETNTWQSLPPMLIPRHGYGAALLDGRIYLPGGAIHQGAGASDQNSVFFFD
jgi:N-acetylneuraminic acid mutarotase